MATATEPKLPTKSQLSDVEVHEISLVDKAAVPKAKFEIAKRMTEPANATVTGAETVEKTGEAAVVGDGQTKPASEVAPVEKGETTGESVEVAKGVTDDELRKALVEISKFCERENAKVAKSEETTTDAAALPKSQETETPTPPPPAKQSLVERAGEILSKKNKDKADDTNQKLLKGVADAAAKFESLLARIDKFDERLSKETGANA